MAMDKDLLKKMGDFFYEQEVVKEKSLVFILSYVKNNWPEVKKTLVKSLQNTLLAKGAMGLFKVDKVKALSYLSNAAIVYANIAVIKKEHEQGIQEYRENLLKKSRDVFIDSLSLTERDELVHYARVLASVYHDRDSKEGLVKFKTMIGLWGDVFNQAPMDRDKFIELISYLNEYYNKQANTFRIEDSRISE